MSSRSLITLQVLYDVAGEDPTREDVLDEVTRYKDECGTGLQQVRTKNGHTLPHKCVSHFHKVV